MFDRGRTGALLLARGLCVGVRDSSDQLLDNLAARLVAQFLNFLDLIVCVLLCVILSLLVAGAVLYDC
jgi:hypothetical protein